jgi:hypothetical protein
MPFPLKPEPRGGRAYKLVYHVPVAIEAYWRFKTDFESDFPVSHNYIQIGPAGGKTRVTQVACFDF